MPQPLARTHLESNVLVALGSNVTSLTGTPAEILRQAIKDLNQNGIHVSAVSRFFGTPCFPAGAGPDYVNAALVAETALAPKDFMDLLHRIEASHGRERAERWGQRTLDLDLIAYGDLTYPDPETFELWRALPVDLQKMRAPGDLILPHPRLQDRAFVLVPLNDVAPQWKHPVLGLTVTQMLANLPPTDTRDVTPLA